MSVARCVLCDHGVETNDDTVWKEVRGFVGGIKKDSMRLRADTGRYAHGECVQKLSDGQAVDQPSLFEDVSE